MSRNQSTYSGRRGERNRGRFGRDYLIRMAIKREMLKHLSGQHGERNIQNMMLHFGQQEERKVLKMKTIIDIYIISHH